MPGRSALTGEDRCSEKGAVCTGCMVQAVNPPVVTRKDSAEVESPATEYRFGRDDAAPGEFGYFGTRNLLLLTASLAWPACLHGRARSFLDGDLIAASALGGRASSVTE
jgi:hypothetical protein